MLFKNATRRLFESFLMTCNCATVGRYSVGSAPPGPDQRATLVATTQSPFAIVGGNTLNLGPGKYIASMVGRVIAPGGNGIQVSLESTTGGPNLSGYTFPAAASEPVTLVGAWEGTADAEQVWVGFASTPTPPTFDNCFLYVVRLGD
jgi:hypothetical protein